MVGIGHHILRGASMEYKADKAKAFKKKEFDSYCHWFLYELIERTQPNE